MATSRIVPSLLVRIDPVDFTVKLDQSTAAAAAAALTQAALDLVDTEVRAPRSGRVMTTNIKTGEYAQVGKELLALVSEDLGA